MIETRDVDGVRVLQLAHGKANLLDTDLLAGLDESLDHAEKVPIGAVVLTGTGNIFSAGVDLFRVTEGGKEYLEEFLPALSESIVRLFTFPKPVIAAVNGHAIAGGCILVCACDARLGIPEGGRIGVTELKVGVPFPAAALEVVRFVVPGNRLSEAILEARTYSPKDALAMGYLDRLVDPDELLDRAVEQASRLAELGERVFSFSKRQLRREAFESIERQRPTSDKEVLEAWSRPHTLRRIREYLDQTLGRRS